MVDDTIGMPNILWSVDTLDWKTRDTDATIKSVKEEAYDGAIILMHDIKDNTAESARMTVEYLQKHGYLCVTVEDLFAYYHVELAPNHHYAYAVK